MVLLIGIIKIIGIIILIIAAVVLLLIAAVLFVPLRYRIEGSFRDEKPCGCATVKWMLGMLSFRASYSDDGGAKAYISLFGRCIYDLFGDDETDEGTTSDAAAESITEPKQHAAENIDEVALTANISEGEHEGSLGNSDHEGSCRNTDAAAEKSAESGRSIDGKQEKHKLTGIGTVKDRIFMSIRKACDKVSELIDSVEMKLRELAAQVAEMFRAVREAFDKRSGQLKGLCDLWNDERYQASKQLLMSRIFRLLKELRPRKGHGELRLGTGDPYSTGQVMQAAAFLYPLYGGVIDVIPDFNRSIIDGEAKLKGRVRLIIPAEAALRIFLDKGLKRMYKEARSILELD